jgi:ATP-dependent Zn protease
VHPIGEETARQIKDRVRSIVENAHQVTGEGTGAEPSPVRLARKLLTKESLEAPEVEGTFSGLLSESYYRQNTD